jgi:hypothetical protein
MATIVLGIMALGRCMVRWMLRPIQQRFHGQLDATFLVGLEHFHPHHLALGQDIRDLGNALMADLADVQQAVFARQ